MIFERSFFHGSHRLQLMTFFGHRNFRIHSAVLAAYVGPLCGIEN
jgi:hypothetical protein